MRKALQIGKKFFLPLELVTSTQAILARKRSGKSYTASVEAEELLKANQQIAVIDPTGAWHGLKSSADGQKAGFAVVVFGGEHADVPLEPNAGALLARTMVEQGFSAIFDVSLMGVSEAIRFVADFCHELFRVNREAMHLFIDEADAYAPEKPFGEETKSLHAVKRLVKQGGIRGIGVTMITQRSQQLSKAILSQVDILTVLRMSHPLDLKAAYDWIATEVNPEFAAEVKAALPSLPVGTAFICSAGLHIGERVKVRERITFNSGATPKPGEKRVQPKVLAQVDLDKLGKEIQATIERAKADDPAELRKRIVDLERKLKTASAEVKVEERVEEKLVEVPMLADKQLDLLQEFVGRIEAVRAGLGEELRIVSGHLEGIQTSQARVREQFAPKAAAAAAQPASSREYRLERAVEVDREAIRVTAAPVGRHSASNGDASVLSAPKLKVLNAIAELRMLTGRAEIPREQVAAWSGYSITASTFGIYVGGLAKAGMVEYPSPGMLSITPAGTKAASPEPVRGSRDAAVERAKSIVAAPEARILDAIWRRRKDVSREEIAKECDYSLTASTFGIYVGRLKALGLIEYPRKGYVVAADWLYLDRR